MVRRMHHEVIFKNSDYFLQNKDLLFKLLLLLLCVGSYKWELCPRFAGADKRIARVDLVNYIDFFKIINCYVGLGHLDWFLQ